MKGITVEVDEALSVYHFRDLLLLLVRSADNHSVEQTRVAIDQHVGGLSVGETETNHRRLEVQTGHIEEL